MTELEKAARQALEALEKQVRMSDGWTSHAESQAITALRRVLEQQSAEEPVAMVGSDYQLLWTGNAYLADHVQKYGIKVGSLLYTRPQPAAQWVGLTDDEKRSVCRVGPVYAPDGVVTRKPLEYRKELEGVALMAVRQADSLLREKNGGAA